MSCEDVQCPPDIDEGDYGGGHGDSGAIIVDAIGLISGVVGAASFISSYGGLFISLAGFMVPVFVVVQWLQRCALSPSGVQTCMAGIVDDIRAPETMNRVPYVGGLDPVASATSWANANLDLFPFLKEPPAFTLVVKCVEWTTLQTSVGYYRKNRDRAGEPLAPIVTCYLEDPDLCRSLVRMAVGSLVGAGVGTLLGNAAQGAMLAACGATVICGILALLVFLVIAVVGAIVGAIVGDAVPVSSRERGFSEADPNTVPDTGRNETISFVRVGDYVAVKGKLTNASWLQNSKCFWFVEEAFWYGHESSVLPPYSHCEPDVFLHERNDEGEFLVDENGDLIASETTFCESLPCLVFDDFAGMGLALPATVRPGWELEIKELGDTASQAELVTWGEPMAQSKLFLSDQTLVVVVSDSGRMKRVVARVGWMGGTALKMIGYDVNGDPVGYVEAPRVQNQVHQIEIESTGLSGLVQTPDGSIELSALDIRSVEFHAQEGLVVDICAYA